jgi:hypothetical protein
MFRPSSLQVREVMYSGDLIKDLFETVARAEAAAQVSATRRSSSAGDQDLTRDPSAQALTARKVPAAVSSEPG